VRISQPGFAARSFHARECGSCAKRAPCTEARLLHHVAIPPDWERPDLRPDTSVELGEPLAVAAPYQQPPERIHALAAVMHDLRQSIQFPERPGDPAWRPAQRLRAIVGPSGADPGDTLKSDRVDPSFSD